MQAIWRRISATCAVAAASVAFVPAASAAITPTVTLDQSAGTAAGSTVNLGTDLKFAPTGSDSPKDLTLKLPAGLLANASIDGGACLRNAAGAQPVPACKVGSGKVTASGVVMVLGMPVLVPVAPLPVTFDLVKPPKPSDLAGLELFVSVLGHAMQLGSPADIVVRPASDPGGVGLNIAFTNIPDTFPLLGPVAIPISVDELNSTFDGLRLPASCPAAPARISVTGDSYGDPTTQKTASAPLNVTGCSSLPFSPAFHVTAARDSSDSGVQIVTDITQPAKPPEATSRTVALALPAAVVAPNVAAVLSGGILCTSATFAGCKPIGSASSTSPLYPTALAGRAFLTGSLTAPAITIVFPAPFSLTLGGTVDLATNTTTFHNLPDIPLTDLKVTLSGGPNAAFMTTCATPSGTAKATLTAQNGDHTATPSSTFTVSGCPSQAGGAGGARGKGPSSNKAHTTGRPQIEAASFSGLARGRPTLSFKLVAGRNAPKLSSFTIELPRGLSFARRRVHKRLRITGVSVKGAQIRSLVLGGGKLTVTLRRPVSSLSVKLAPAALRESRWLRQRAKHHQIKSLKLTVVVRNVNHKSTTATLQIANLQL
jgi:hypothetical protein